MSKISASTYGVKLLLYFQRNVTKNDKKIDKTRKNNLE
jgi:hypothetical protein